MALIATGASMASELMAQGRESAAVLEALLQGASLPPAHGGVHALAAEILRCCDRALAVMRGGGEAESLAGTTRKAAPGAATAQATRRKRRAIANVGGAAPAATRVEKARTSEDGFLWRKYGQKEIKNSKHPRLYFRCSYKEDDGCMATRHVQQSEDDPSLYVITYFGDHTCSCKAAAAATALDVDDKNLQQFVINFGSPPLLYDDASYNDGDVWRETATPPSSQQSRCSPEEDGEDSVLKMSKEELVDSCPAPSAVSSPADVVSCVSPALEPLLGCFNWDDFGDSSFVNVDEFMIFDEIDMFQI